MLRAAAEDRIAAEEHILAGVAAGTVGKTRRNDTRAAVRLPILLPAKLLQYSCLPIPVVFIHHELDAASKYEIKIPNSIFVETIHVYNRGSCLYAEAYLINGGVRHGI